MRNRSFQFHSACSLALAAVSAWPMRAQLSGQMPTQSALTGDAQAKGGSAQGAPDASIQRLRQLVDSGHPQEALTEVAKLRASLSTAKGLDEVEGQALYATGEVRRADVAFAAALQQEPGNAEAAQMRGLTLLRLGRPADAIPLLEGSRGTTAGKADPNYVLALCYIDTRRYEDARSALALQYGFPADSAAAYLIAARMLLRREYLPVAQSFAEKAIAIDGTLPLAHELLGEIALAGNHLDEAILQLEKEKSRNPLEGVVYERLGDAFLRNAKYDDAEASLQKAVLLEPNSTGPYILLGKTMLKKSDPAAAGTYLARAEQMDPENFMTHSLLGQAYRAMGRKDEAAREAETAQKLQAAAEPKLESIR